MSSVQPPGKDASALARPAGSGGALHETAERFTARQVGDVYQFMYRYVGNREEAERLTERVFFQAMPALRDLRARQTVQPAQTVDSLLARIARATVADELRERYRATPDSAARVVALIHPESPIAMRDRGGSALAYAQSVLARLPAPERDLLTYRFLLNSPLESVAQVMGLSAHGALALQWAALAHAAQIVASDYQATPAHEREA